MQSLPVSDRESHTEATVLSFVAEHSLPLAVAPHLVQFAKHMAEDQATLNLSMQQSSASYKLKYGPVKTFKEELKADIADQFFCLNLEEVMSSTIRKF